MPAYDAGFNPPAPVAGVTAAHPVSGASSGALRGKLDSGADVTVVPERLIAQLGRNVLNRFLITLDGKNLTFELQDP